RAARQVTQLELELQGEVDKYLSAVFLLSLQNEGAVSPRLRALLFRHYRLAAHVTEGGRGRYRAASELAYRYCGWLEESFLRPSRLADLVREARRFYRLGQRQKLERIADVALARLSPAPTRRGGTGGGGPPPPSRAPPPPRL